MENTSSKEESSSIVAEELRFRKITKVAKKTAEISSSRVFKMFREGRSPMDVVEETGADPTIIRDWFRLWVEMNEDWRMWREPEEAKAEDWIKKGIEKLKQLEMRKVRDMRYQQRKETEAYAKSLIKEIEVEAKNKIEELKGRLGSAGAIKLQGKKTSGLITGMCYIIAKERDLSDVVTQTLLAETYGTTTQTVMKDVKLLKQLMQNPVIKQNGKD